MQFPKIIRRDLWMLCLIPALASALFGAPKQKFPVEIFVELNHASPLVLLELDPARPVTAETKTLRGLPVVNVMNIRIRQMREGMAEDVRDSVLDSQEDPADCFVPRYAIHAWTGKVNLDLFFSFQCRRLVCYLGTEKYTFSITDKLESFFVKNFEDIAKLNKELDAEEQKQKAKEKKKNP